MLTEYVVHGLALQARVVAGLVAVHWESATMALVAESMHCTDRVVVPAPAASAHGFEHAPQLPVVQMKLAQAGRPVHAMKDDGAVPLHLLDELGSMVP